MVGKVVVDTTFPETPGIYLDKRFNTRRSSAVFGGPSLWAAPSKILVTLQIEVPRFPPTKTPAEVRLSTGGYFRFFTRRAGVRLP